MSSLEGNVSNLVQGVSQQDPKIRAAGQHTAQKNCRSNIALGLTPRPGSKFEYLLDPTITINDNTYIHTYSSAGNKYVVYLNEDGMCVTDEAGVIQPLAGPETEEYTAEYQDPATTGSLNYSDYAGPNMSAFTIGDTTFILNRDKVVTDYGVNPPTQDYSFIYIKKVTFGLNYIVKSLGNPIASDASFPNSPANADSFTVNLGGDILSQTYTVNFPTGARDTNTWQVFVNGSTTPQTGAVITIHSLTSITLSGFIMETGDDIVIRQLTHNLVEVNMPTTAALASGEVRLAQIPSVQSVCYSLAHQLQIVDPTATIAIINDNIIAINKDGLTIDDDSAGDDIVSFKNRIPRYEDLPIGLHTPDGAPIIEVVGDVASKYTYYLQPEGEYEMDSTPDEIAYIHPEDGTTETFTPDYIIKTYDYRWKEVGSGFDRSDLSQHTMPHILVQTNDGFMFKPADWGVRAAGDAESNQDPKFVGSVISDMGAYQNRLVMLAGRYVCASRTDEWFDFWKDTVIADNPANPCFIAAGGTQSTNVTVQLDRLAVVAGELLIITKEVQYKISGQSEFTNSSPMIPVLTFALDTTAPVADSGTGVLVAAYSGRYSNIKELTVTGDSRMVYPVNLTDHCPFFIRGRVKQFIMHTALDIGFALADKLYIYEASKNQAGQQIQNAWSFWEFGTAGEDAVRKIWLNDNSLMILLLAQVYNTIGETTTKTPTYMVCSIPIELQSPEFLDFRPCLDRMQEEDTEVSGEYLNFIDTDIGDNVTILLGADTDSPGSQVETVSTGSGPAIADTEDIETGTAVIVGVPYTQETELSPLYLRHQDGTPRTQGRTQLQRMWLDYTYTARVAVTVTDKAGRTSAAYWDTTEDSVNGIYDQIVLQAGTLVVPLRGTNTDVSIKITSNDYKPWACTSLQFSARYGKKRTARAKNRVQS